MRGLNFRADMQIRPYHFHKLNGASGWNFASTRQMVIVNWGAGRLKLCEGDTLGWLREFGGAERVDLCEYTANGLREFSGAGRLELCEYTANGLREFGGAERVDLCEDSTLGRICKSAPTIFTN